MLPLGVSAVMLRTDAPGFHTAPLPTIGLRGAQICAVRFDRMSVPGERVLLVAAYRQEDTAGLSGWLDHLAERRAVTTLSLSRLSLEDTTRFLKRMSSRTFGELPSLASFLQEESEGNPFYAVEFALVDRDWSR
jgi:alkylation response protein AidB-like acyl-CoA dehydrogenase